MSWELRPHILTPHELELPSPHLPMVIGAVCANAGFIFLESEVLNLKLSESLALSSSAFIKGVCGEESVVAHGI